MCLSPVVFANKPREALGDTLQAWPDLPLSFFFFQTFKVCPWNGARKSCFVRSEWVDEPQKLLILCVVFDPPESVWVIEAKQLQQQLFYLLSVLVLKQIKARVAGVAVLLAFILRTVLMSREKPADDSINIWDLVWKRMKTKQCSSWLPPANLYVQGGAEYYAAHWEFAHE